MSGQSRRQQQERRGPSPPWLDRPPTSSSSVSSATFRHATGPELGTSSAGPYAYSAVGQQQPPYPLPPPPPPPAAAGWMESSSIAPPSWTDGRATKNENAMPYPSAAVTAAPHYHPFGNPPPPPHMAAAHSGPPPGQGWSSVPPPLPAPARVSSMSHEASPSDSHHSHPTPPSAHSRSSNADPSHRHNASSGNAAGAAEREQGRPLKLTPSCARCRAKKLKCDQQTPCSNCIAKKVEHECQKEERAPRQPKKRKNDGSNGIDVELDSEGNPISGGGGEEGSGAARIDIGSLKRRVVELEAQLAASESAIPNQAPPRQYKVEGTAAFLEEYIHRDASNFTPVAVFGVHGDELEAPAAAHEAKRDKTLVAFMNEFGGARLKERPNAYWSKHVNRAAKLALTEEIREAFLSLGPEVRADLIGYCLPTRAMGMFSRCIATPELEENLEDFLAKRGRYATQDADMNQLGLFCVGCSVGIQFYPGVGTVRRANPLTMKIWTAAEVRKYKDLAMRCLALEHNLSVTSLEGLQALVLISGQGLDDAHFLSYVDDILRRGVIAMELNKLGNLPLLGYEKGTTAAQCRRKEMAVRVFWVVVQRDWFLGQQTRSYSFHPGQITTRPPLNLTDDDMREIPFHASRPFDEWTPCSLSIAKIHLAHLVRGSVDMLNEQAQNGGSSRVWNLENRAKLDEQYQHFLKQLPEFFHLDVPFQGAEGWKGIAEVQRWLIHQLVFSLLLKLHRSDLGKKRVQQSCISLANVVLEIHDKIRKRCRIIDSMAMNQDHIYSACIVLVLDLYADKTAEARKATGIDRIQIRSKIRRAAGWLNRHQSRTAKAARLLDRLLDEEERHLQQNGETETVGHARLLEVAASMNREEQAMERGEKVEKPVDDPRLRYDAGLDHAPRADVNDNSPLDANTTPESRSASQSTELPQTPIDTALYPSLVWPYDPPDQANADGSQPFLLASLDTFDSGAAERDTGAGQTIVNGTGAPVSSAAWADPSTLGDSVKSVEAQQATGSFNDDLLWQLVFGSTTQTGVLANSAS